MFGTFWECFEFTFDQLFGGGQGVYGKAEHPGVKINNLNETKTIYFQNTKGWENLKLMYTYSALGNTWTTVVDGIELGDAMVSNIYKVTVPADVHSFTIIGDGEGETTPEIAMSGLVWKITKNYYDRKSGIDVKPMLSAYPELNEEFEKEI